MLGAVREAIKTRGAHRKGTTKMETNRKAIGERFRKALRRQGGFTLIELGAVMAILAILVTIVAPVVTNTQKTSVRAQAQSDSQVVRTAANDFFIDQEQLEVTTPHSVTVTVDQNDGDLVSGNQEQRVSAKWPEIFITEEGTPPVLRATDTDDSKYSVVFPTTGKASDGKVVDVTLSTDGGELSIDGEFGLLQDFTAVDLDLLVDEGFMAVKPAGEERLTDTGVDSLEVPNFLWLFEKRDSSGGTNDGREIVVFELVRVDRNDGTVALTYEQIR